MKIVIDIDDEDYKRIQDISDVFNSLTSRTYSAIRNGTPLPEGAEILTKEAYSDLCVRAADVPETNVGELISKDAVLDLVANYDLSMGEVVRGIHDLPSFTLQPEKRTKERTKTHACDCISRQAAEAIFRNAKKSLYEQSRKGKIEYKEFQIREMMLLNAEQFIHLLPSVEPERKTGKWIDGKCNRCGTHAPFWEMATTYYCSEYCPKCGADMREVQDARPKL